MTTAELPLTLEDIEVAVAARVAPISIREGDWADYQRHLAMCADGRQRRIVDAYGSVAAYKRICAYAYLGSRTTMSGSLYVRAQPRIFTDAAIAALRAGNDEVRRRRYPLLAEEVAQALAAVAPPAIQQARSGNVVSLLRATLSAPSRLADLDIGPAAVMP